MALIIAAVLVALAIGITVLGWRALRLRQRPEPRPGDDEPPDIFLVVPPGLTRRNGSPGPAPWMGPPRREALEGMASTGNGNGNGAHPGSLAQPGQHPAPAPWQSRSLPGLAPLARRAAVANGNEEARQVGTVHYEPPPEGTLHILPGRLEVLGGSGRMEELRFVRLPGREPVITFGRSEGEPHAHVRLESPTVSRIHAAMLLVDGKWHIENRSRTNPVTVNGNPMSADGGPPVRLADGDLIEMGAVCLRFRER